MTSAPMTIDDNYTGAIAAGGSPQRRTLAGARIIKASVGPMDNNAYLVTCSQTGQSLLIDAANDAGTLGQLIDENAPQLTMIVTTHQHPDHWQALADTVAGFDCPSAAHPDDASALPIPPTRMLEDGDTVSIGRLTFTAIHLSGHTPGSIALALNADGVTHLFTGDSLFPGGPGKTGSPEQFTRLMDDLERKVFDKFGDTTIVYPGHGKDTTLGAERPHLQEWRQRGW